VNNLFRKFAHKTSELVGSPWAFIVATAVIVVWAIAGPIFHFSDTWQLTVNTGTTIITFLMVFLIQNTQNRDATAIHLKLDELIRGVKGARTGMVALEDLNDEQLARLKHEFDRMHQRFDDEGDEGDEGGDGGDGGDGGKGDTPPHTAAPPPIAEGTIDAARQLRPPPSRPRRGRRSPRGSCIHRLGANVHAMFAGQHSAGK
jgi:low affinity Fe/Cu permease